MKQKILKDAKKIKRCKKYQIKDAKDFQDNSNHFGNDAMFLKTYNNLKICKKSAKHFNDKKSLRNQQ